MSNIAVIIFGISVLFGISYQFEPELLPEPPPRNPPDQAKYYRDGKWKTYKEDFDSLTRRWACASGPVLYMRWPDLTTTANQSDLWFDRLVYIHHEGHYEYIIKKFTDYPFEKNKLASDDLSITLNGIILEEDRILTSYNPFRQVIKYPFKRQFTHVCALQARKMGNDSDDNFTYFKTTYHSIACARQVVPLEETSEMLINLWHGKATQDDYMRQHSPLHDLMVIRIEGIIPNMTADNYDLNFFKTQTAEFFAQGPQKTILAKKDDAIGREFKFAMMGHIFARESERNYMNNMNNQHETKHKDELKRMRNTYVGYYNESDNVLIDCDGWIPREWGLFICVLNKRELRRLASGAALYSRGLLFGIGSFTLFKGTESIIVFTDVRPYESLITNNLTGPCTTIDQFGEKIVGRHGNDWI